LQPPQKVGYLKDAYIYGGQDAPPPLNPRFVAKFARSGSRARLYVEDRYYPRGLYTGAPMQMKTPQVFLREYKDFVTNDPIDVAILTPLVINGQKQWRWGPQLTDQLDPNTMFQFHADHQGRVVLVVDGAPPAYFYFVIDAGLPDAVPDIVGQWRFDFAEKWEAE